MKLTLINPNTTASMTETMCQAASEVVSSDVRLTALTARYGPESIEGYYDEAFCVPAIIEAVGNDTDAVVVGCFDDTGVDALRCVVDGPVVGLCQASMQAASLLGNGFTVVTTLSRSVPAIEHLALRYGFERECKRVRASEVPVLALEEQDESALKKIRFEIEQALIVDRAEVIVLGCAGMASLARELSDLYEVPVIEGVTVATKWAESMARIGLKTSRKTGYARPCVKSYSGDFARFAPKEHDAAQ